MYIDIWKLFTALWICHAVVWFDRLATICSSIVPKVSKEKWCDEQTSHRYRQNRCTMILIFFPSFLVKFKRIPENATYLHTFVAFFCRIFFINICLGFFTFLDWQKQKQIPIDIYQFWSQRSNFVTTANLLLNKILYKSVGIWAQCTYIEVHKEFKVCSKTLVF